VGDGLVGTTSVGKGVIGGGVITSVVGAGVSSGGSVPIGGAVSGGRVAPGVGANVLFVPASTTVVDVARSSRSSVREANTMLLECIIYISS
jgi:hypothetical protein